MKNELEKTCREEENEKQEEQLQILLWEQELEKHLADKPFLVNQLQKNLLENDEQKELENQELQEKNFDKIFQKMIFQKLVALMPEKHFVLAASSRLLGNEAWEEHREASKEISFDRVGDKELPPELRRAQLDCKDLRSACFRALCPTSFEENSFTEETFSNTSLGDETFKESSLTTSSFTESSLTKNSFTESSLTKNSFTESSLTKKSFDKNSFEKNRFLENSFSENAFLKNSFSQKSLDEKSFDKKSFDKKSLNKQTFSRQLRAQQRGGTELPASTNFRGWRRVWGEPGENRGGTGGRTGGAQKNRGRTGGIWEENRGRTGGFWYSFTKSTGGEAGALGQEPGENRGREFSLNQRPKSEPENQRTGPPVKISTS